MCWVCPCSLPENSAPSQRRLARQAPVSSVSWAAGTVLAVSTRGTALPLRFTLPAKFPCFPMTTVNTWPRQSAPLVTQSMGLHWSLDRLPECFLSKWHPRQTTLTFLTGPCSISLPWKAASYLLKCSFLFLNFSLNFFLVFAPLLDLSSFFLFEC